MCINSTKKIIIEKRIKSDKYKRPSRVPGIRAIAIAKKKQTTDKQQPTTMITIWSALVYALNERHHYNKEGVRQNINYPEDRHLTF